MHHRPALIFFARAPRSGEVKTRLLPSLGAEAAAELYRCFLLDTLARADSYGAEVLVSAAEAEQVRDLSALAEQVCPSATMLVQTGSDLGARMLNAMRTALADGRVGAVIVGTDSPNLPQERIAEALARVSQHDVVLGPSQDGGYYLVGMKAALPRLFEGIPWSTPVVLSETLRRAEELSLRAQLLEPWYDVDTPEDLETLRADLAAQEDAGEPLPCPRTWEYLRSLPEVR